MIAHGRRLAVVALLFVACSAYRVETVDTLYFGTQKPDKTAVTREEWDAFMRSDIEPRIDGSTQWQALGEYKGEREATIVLQIIHDGSADAAIDAIIAAYKKRFAQESVLRVRTRAGVAFQ